jgi:hypothetical protein
MKYIKTFEAYLDVDGNLREFDFVDDTKAKYMDFKQKLIDAGIYPKSIVGVYYEHTPRPYWVVTIPYGHPGGGKDKVFRRFGEADVEKAVNFWFSNIDREKPINW